MNAERTAGVGRTESLDFDVVILVFVALLRNVASVAFGATAFEDVVRENIMNIRL